MGIALQSDYTVVTDADSATSWFPADEDFFDPVALNTNVKAQGSGSISALFVDFGLGGALFNPSASIYTRRYLGIWMLAGGIEVETEANGGMRIRMGSSTGSTPSNWKEWFIAGQDTAIGLKENGWQQRRCKKWKYLCRL